jgi:hypothetical protein
MYLFAMCYVLLNNTYLFIAPYDKAPVPLYHSAPTLSRVFYNFFIFFIAIICFYFVTKMAKGMFNKVGYIIATTCYHPVAKMIKVAFDPVGYTIVNICYHFVIKITKEAFGAM